MRKRLALLALVTISLLSFPARPPAGAAVGVRWGYYTGYDKVTSLPSLQAHVNDLNYVSPWYGFEVDASGKLAGADDPEVTSLIRSAGAKVLPLVQNAARYNEFHNLIADPVKRSQLAATVTELVLSNHYDGVNIDFEGINATDRPYLTAFMAELYPKLHGQRKLVTIALPAKTREVTTGWAGAYDYPALAPYAHLHIIMAYDYHYPGGPPGAVAPLPWVNEVTQYARTQLGASKVVVSLPLYGYDWNTTTGAKATSTKYPQIAILRRDYGAVLGYDAASQSATATYTRDGQQHQVWYDNGRSLDAKLAVVRQAGVAGVALWRLGQEDPRVWNSVRGLSVGASLPTFSPNADRYQDDVTLSYRLEVPAVVKLQVFDAAGRAVRTLLSPMSQQAGVYSARWDGRGDAGNALADGAYTARVTATVGASPVTDSTPISLNTSLGRLGLSRTRYSPSAAGALTATYALASPARVSASVVQGNRVVRALRWASSQAPGSYTLSWDGRDSTGARASEGGYSVVVVADGSAGRSALRRDLYVDVRPPEITNARLSSPRFYVNGATSQVWSYYLGEAATAELQVTRSGQAVRTIRWTQNAGGRSLGWSGYEGSALAPSGTYAYTLVATDLAGNRSAVVSGSFAIVR